jgi:antitoxin (DNA-binding transcriptional repressor) of toxin-antitoxin stability system
MHEAKSSLSSMVRELREGREREIVICIAGRAAAKLVAVAEAPRRQLGVDRGLVTIADDFDTVNAQITGLFEGR